MARNQVYGKRSHLYSKTNLFTSPIKHTVKADVVGIAEITEELGRLAVQEEAQEPVAGKPEQKRRMLGEKAVNSVTISQVTDSKPTCPLKSTRKVKTRNANVVNEVAHEPTPVETTSQEPTPSLAIPDTVSRTLQHEDTENVPPGEGSAPLEEVTSQLLKVAISTAAPPPPPNVYERHTADLLRHSLRPLTSFSTWSDQLSSHFSVSKIAEASFGEVYRLSLLHHHASISKKDESVLKIIALKPPHEIPKKKGNKKLSKAAKARVEMMSNPIDVASEVRLMQRMSCIPGSTNFRDVCVLQGRPGTAFVNAWKSWNEERRSKGKDTSEFPDPGKKASYGDDQLWAVIEMQDAGTDLENAQVDNIWMTWDVFWGVVLAIGKGEEGARFEHRDLHLGNICVSNRTGQKGGGGVSGGWREQDVDVKRKFGFTGIETTIIDYTISRAEMGELRPGCASYEAEESDVAFFDLEVDEILFQGDGEKEYQYDIYRYMRSAMYLDEPLADIYERWDEATDTGRTWQGYHPQTNLVWMHFVLHKLLEQLEWPSSSETSEDATDVAEMRRRRGCELERVLRDVQKLLDPKALPCSGLKSTSDLVALALSESWLDIEDVVGVRTKSSAKKGSATRTRKGQSKRTKVRS